MNNNQQQKLLSQHKTNLHGKHKLYDDSMGIEPKIIIKKKGQLGLIGGKTANLLRNRKR